MHYNVIDGTDGTIFAAATTIDKAWSIAAKLNVSAGFPRFYVFAH